MQASLCPNHRYRCLATRRYTRSRSRRGITRAAGAPAVRHTGGGRAGGERPPTLCGDRPRRAKPGCPEDPRVGPAAGAPPAAVRLPDSVGRRSGSCRPDLAEEPNAPVPLQSVHNPSNSSTSRGAGVSWPPLPSRTSFASITPDPFPAETTQRITRPVSRHNPSQNTHLDNILHADYLALHGMEAVRPSSFLQPGPPYGPHLPSPAHLDRSPPSGRASTSRCGGGDRGGGAHPLSVQCPPDPQGRSWRPSRS